MTNNDLIATVLGASAVKFGITIRGRERNAWRTARPLTLDEGLELAERHWREFERHGLLLFAGRQGEDESEDPGWYLIAVEGDKPLDLLEFSHTGPEHLNPVDFDAMMADAGRTLSQEARAILLGNEELRRRMKADLERYSQVDWHVVQRTLRPFYERVPFAAFFADRKGLKAVFKSPITPDFARELGDAICEIDPDLCGSVGPDDMEGFILERNGFELWWD